MTEKDTALFFPLSSPFFFPFLEGAAYFTNAHEHKDDRAAQ